MPLADRKPQFELGQHPFANPMPAGFAASLAAHRRACPTGNGPAEAIPGPIGHANVVGHTFAGTAAGCNPSGDIAYSSTPTTLLWPYNICHQDFAHEPMSGTPTPPTDAHWQNMHPRLYTRT